MAILGKRALVDVRGRGTFNLGPVLKQFGAASVTKHQCDRIIMNMAGCETMDSTFMGVIAGLAMRIKRDRDGSLTMVNLSERTSQLLSTLGLDRVVSAFRAAESPQEDVALFERGEDLSAVNVEAIDRAENVKTMLDAHKDLVAVAPENLARFQDVIEYLNRDAVELQDETS
ncbi:MAG: STAS domain-containing protein [Kiritimatiellae bacterium]|nr:STAS domain-containing protein [Kiritimatiellia bacterium]